jgi:hypothetical protein
VYAAQAAAAAAPLQPFEVRQLPCRAYAVVLTPRYGASDHAHAVSIHMETAWYNQTGDVEAACTDSSGVLTTCAVFGVVGSTTAALLQSSCSTCADGVFGDATMLLHQPYIPSNPNPPCACPALLAAVMCTRGAAVQHDSRYVGSSRQPAAVHVPGGLTSTCLLQRHLDAGLPVDGTAQTGDMWLSGNQVSRQRTSFCCRKVVVVIGECLASDRCAMQHRD